MYTAVHLYYLGGVGGRRLTAGISAIQALFGARENRVMGGLLEGVERPSSETSTAAPAAPTSG
jgi:hypothetical protein